MVKPWKWFLFSIQAGIFGSPSKIELLLLLLLAAGIALNFAVFPTAFLFIYINDVGMVNNDIMIRFSLMTTEFSLSIKIIVSIQYDGD